MRIETLTFVYNEEFLLPFYFKHYDFCDRFNIVYDTESTDRTIELLQENPKVNIIPFTFPDMMDDKIKVNAINKFYKQIPNNIKLLNVDVDEFIFLYPEMLKTFNVNCLLVSLYNVYRHVSEDGLDINKTIREQRRHGELLSVYIKPIIVNTGLDLAWGVGNHSISGVSSVDVGITGAHWSNADPCFCVDRRVKNRALRQSKYNLENGLTIQHHGVTVEDVLNECIAHNNDPEVFNV